MTESIRYIFSRYKWKIKNLGQAREFLNLVHVERYMVIEVFRNFCSQLMTLVQLQFFARVIRYLFFMLKSECVIKSDFKIPFRKCITGGFQWESFHVMTSILLVFIHFSTYLIFLA